MKKKALFIPASIRSHILPSFYLADMLSIDFEVTYAVTDKVLAESAHKNGFKTCKISRFKAGCNNEKYFILDQRKNASFLTILKCYFKNELYWKRKNEIDELLEQVKPDVVLVDVYCSTDFLFLYLHSKKIKIAFFNPMPSTYNVEGYPSVDDNVWLKDNNKYSTNKSIKLSELIMSPQNAILKWVSEKQMQKLIRWSKIPSEHSLIENKFIKAFKNIPELLLLPLEFEFSPAIKKDYQHYLGLSQHENRVDTELDSAFDEKWEGVLEKKHEGSKIVYCSFGTFFENAHPRLLDFINMVLEVIDSIPNVFLVCSVNRYVVQTLYAQHRVFKNAAFFYKVPQLQVLKIADLFITHGGLGGIKESIYYKVPMLVYPLDIHYDQCGNALKVEHHGIGLKGNFMYEQKNYMQAKVKKLLYDISFKIKINEFRANINTVYTNKYHEDLLNKILA
ncbi:glycosyltransferase [Lacihabitans lacunae]|uniref:Glycosyltransferase n=1 Tax=Lacihabitans lacunae TaxID=1028214 RepID=A0ABV7YZH2_9BACT